MDNSIRVFSCISSLNVFFAIYPNAIKEYIASIDISADTYSTYLDFDFEFAALTLF